MGGETGDRERAFFTRKPTKGGRKWKRPPPLHVVPVIKGVAVRKWRGRRLPYWTTKTHCPIQHAFSPPSTLDFPKSPTEPTEGTEGGRGILPQRR